MGLRDLNLDKSSGHPRARGRPFFGDPAIVPGTGAIGMASRRFPIRACSSWCPIAARSRTRSRRASTGWWAAPAVSATPSASRGTRAPARSRARRRPAAPTSPSGRRAAATVATHVEPHRGVPFLPRSSSRRSRASLPARRSRRWSGRCQRRRRMPGVSARSSSIRTTRRTRRRERHGAAARERAGPRPQCLTSQSAGSRTATAAARLDPVAEHASGAAAEPAHIGRRLTITVDAQNVLTGLDGCSTGATACGAGARSAGGCDAAGSARLRPATNAFVWSTRASARCGAARAPSATPSPHPFRPPRRGHQPERPRVRPMRGGRAASAACAISGARRLRRRAGRAARARHGGANGLQRRRPAGPHAREPVPCCSS